MIIEEAKSKVIRIAEAEVGYHEKKSNSQLDDKTANSGSNNFTKYARDLDAVGYYNTRKQGHESCDVTFDWFFWKAFHEEYGLEVCQKMLYQPPKSTGAGCKYSAQFYKNNGAFYKTPEVGDQIFFQYTTEIGHTGLVVKVTASYVYTIEGNSQNMVQRKKYAKTNSTIAGYGRPNWKLVADSEPAPAPRPMLRRGDRGDAVVELQKMLLAHGYRLPKYGADGDYGVETETAVKNFQRDYKLEVDGITGPQTWAALEKTKPVTIDGHKYKLYTVKQGDTLTKIATEHNISRQSIILLNNIKDPNLIQIGQILKIPV